MLTIDVQAIDLEKEMRTILYEEERYADRYFMAKDTVYRNVFLDDNRLFVRYLDSLSGMLSDQSEKETLDLAGQIHDWHFTSVLDADLSPNAVNERADAMDRVRKSLDDLIGRRQRAVDASVRTIDLATERSLRVALLIAIGTFLSAIGAALIITRTITRPIGTLVAGTKEIAVGDIHEDTHPLARRDRRPCPGV